MKAVFFFETFDFLVILRDKKCYKKAKNIKKYKNIIENVKEIIIFSLNIFIMDIDYYNNILNQNKYFFQV